jgi:hypothetical protein
VHEGANRAPRSGSAPRHLRQGPHDDRGRAPRWRCLKGVLPAGGAHRDRLASQVERGPARRPRSSERRQPASRASSAATSPARSGSAVGDVVSVTSPTGRLSPYGMVPSIKKFRVAGTVHSGLYEFDAQWAYIPARRGPAPLHRGQRQRLAGGGARATTSTRSATWRRASWPLSARAISRRTGS